MTILLLCRQLCQCLDQDLNLDLDLRRVLCDPLHHRDVFNKYPDQESNLDQGLRSALCDPLHHRDRQTRADDWICTSMMRFTKPPPRCSATSASFQQEREDLNPVRRLWRPSALPGARSSIRPRPAGPGASWRNDYSPSVTFQYASLTNFDQLFIRMPCSA